MQARWIDIGLVAPAQFHATYMGLAAQQSEHAAPIILWGRTTAHISIGQSQHRNIELIAGLEIAVVQRLLGGGTVWVDESQYCYVLIVPRMHARGGPQQWFEWGLAAALATYREFGLQVVREQQDLWLARRKIGGSGAATLDQCAVVASSFLYDFPVERFAACIACASEGFRTWLIEALRDAMTDWRSHHTPPSAEHLAAVFKRQVNLNLDWQCADSALNDAEQGARDEALVELNNAEMIGSGRRLIPHGVKLNAQTFLTERWDGTHWVRVLTVGGKFARIALSHSLPPHALQQLAACRPLVSELYTCLSDKMNSQEAHRWSKLILETAHFSEV